MVYLTAMDERNLPAEIEPEKQKRTWVDRKGNVIEDVPDDLPPPTPLSELKFRRGTPFSRDRQTMFLELVAQGYPTKRAAEEVGCSWRHVFHHLAKNKELKAEYEEARDQATGAIEFRLQSIALHGDPTNMATVRAAEVYLKGQSRRYHNQPPPSSVDIQTPGGSMNVRIGMPGPD